MPDNQAYTRRAQTLEDQISNFAAHPAGFLSEVCPGSVKTPHGVTAFKSRTVRDRHPYQQFGTPTAEASIGSRGYSICTSVPTGRVAKKILPILTVVKYNRSTRDSAASARRGSRSRGAEVRASTAVWGALASRYLARTTDPRLE